MYLFSYDMTDKESQNSEQKVSNNLTAAWAYESSREHQNKQTSNDWGIYTLFFQPNLLLIPFLPPYISIVNSHETTTQDVPKWSHHFWVKSTRAISSERSNPIWSVSDC